MVHQYLTKLLAQASYTMPTIKGPGIDPGTNGTTALEKIISQIIGVLTIVAVIYFAIQVIIAGYNYISSEGDEKKLEAARQSLTNGVLGLVIVVVAVGLGSLIATLAGIPNVLDLNTMFTNMGIK
jgi:formate-dependent nitrite reductase membrane component NrfD